EGEGGFPRPRSGQAWRQAAGDGRSEERPSLRQSERPGFMSAEIADIITRLQMMTQEGSRSDRRLAALVLSDLDFASKAAISEIAARAEVSEPTVTRFCRNLGCEGVRDFKFWLAQAIAI